MLRIVHARSCGYKSNNSAMLTMSRSTDTVWLVDEVTVLQLQFFWSASICQKKGQRWSTTSNTQQTHCHKFKIFTKRAIILIMFIYIDWDWDNICTTQKMVLQQHGKWQTSVLLYVLSWCRVCGWQVDSSAGCCYIFFCLVPLLVSSKLSIERWEVWLGR